MNNDSDDVNIDDDLNAKPSAIYTEKLTDDRVKDLLKQKCTFQKLR